MEKLIGAVFLAVLVAARPSSKTLTSLAPGTTKVDIHNVTLNELTELYLNVDQDLTSLKISKSRIGKIDRFAFDRFKHLNLLELSDNEIEEEIDPVTFSRLPGLEILVLKSLGLQSLSLNLKNVQELILSGNKINELKASSIKGENIYYMDVSANRLETLSESLGALNKLSMLDLSKNKISYIGADVFVNNTNLMRIMASENRITSTRGLALPWLRTLDLFANRIESLDSKAFFQMKSLEELVLAFNNIKLLDDPFRDLLEIKFLNLAWNRIEYLQPGLFRNNLYLTKLSLQGNKLYSVSRFPKVLYHLSHLDLSHNQLSLIEKDFFTTAPNLHFLDLSFNRLKTVSQVLEPLASLNVLGLAYNNIVLSGSEFSRNLELAHLNLSSNGLDLSLNSFRNNPLLKTLDLSKNKISRFCDIHLSLKNLAKLNLRQNQITSLSCLEAKNFESLCEIDVRRNPLACEPNLHHFIGTWASRRSSPVAKGPHSHSDLHSIQCEILSLNDSIQLWNSVKQELCPGGELVEFELEDSEEKGNENKEVGFPEIQKLDNEFVNLAFDTPQSERKSWEEIEEIPELLEILEDNEGAEEEESATSVVTSDPYTWKAIAPIFIGLGLTIVFLKLAVFAFLCIRLKFWKKTGVITSQKYIFLQNEIYKKTTEPSGAGAGVQGDEDHLVDNQTRNKLLSFNFFHNFGYWRKEKNAESDKNVLITS